MAELRAIVKRYTSSQICRQFPQAPLASTHRGLRTKIGKLVDLHQAAFAFHQRQEAVAVARRENRVSLPIAIATATVNHVRATSQANAVRLFVGFFSPRRTVTQPAAVAHVAPKPGINRLT